MLVVSLREFRDHRIEARNQGEQLGLLLGRNMIRRFNRRFYFLDAIISHEQILTRRAALSQLRCRSFATVVLYSLSSYRHELQAPSCQLLLELCFQREKLRIQMRERLFQFLKLRRWTVYFEPGEIG